MSEKFKPHLEFEKKSVETPEENIYGKERFSPETAKEVVDDLLNSFSEHYALLGYQQVPSVKITSGIDPTVRFIGSHISVFKPYLNSQSIAPPGLFMQQDCLRTRNVDKLFDDSFSPQWGSYFSSMGVLSTPTGLEEGCRDVFSFLERTLHIQPNNILVRAFSEDSDLIAAARVYCDDRLEMDSRKPEYYRHQIGVPGVIGRNFNIALRDPVGEGFSDIGNVILLEDDQGSLGIEVALGSSVILKQLHALDHVQDCIPVIGLEVIEDQVIRRKFEDSIITSCVLYREGLRPFGQGNRNRILKQYVRSLSYFRGRAGFELDRVQELISSFENVQFQHSEQSLSAETIREYIQAFENELFMKRNLTEDEKKIVDALS